jgi:hypothetical protein
VYRSKPVIIASVLCCLFVDPIWRNLLYIPCGNGELIQTLLSGLGRRTIFTTVNGVSTLRLFTIAHLDVFSPPWSDSRVRVLYSGGARPVIQALGACGDGRLRGR